MLFPTRSRSQLDIRIIIIEKIADTEIALVCIESRRKSMHIASGIGTAATAGDGGESNEDWGLFIFRGEEGRGRDIRPVSIRREDTVGANAPGMDRAFGDLIRQCK